MHARRGSTLKEGRWCFGSRHRVSCLEFEGMRLRAKDKRSCDEGIPDLFVGFRTFVSRALDSVCSI